MKRAAEDLALEELFNSAVNTFKKEIKSYFTTKECKILKEDWQNNQILIEFADNLWEKMYPALCKIKVVSIIDCI